MDTAAYAPERVTMSQQVRDLLLFGDASSRISTCIRYGYPKHPAIYQAGDAEGLLFIAMRYVGGQDLGSMPTCQASLGPDVALLILTKIGSGLDAAHAPRAGPP